MIRVLQVLPGLNRGGLETFVMNIFRCINRNEIQFDFLTNMERGDYYEEIIKLGGNIFYVPPRNKGLTQYFSNLKCFFEEHGAVYNAIHYHESSLTSLEVLHFAKKARIPIRIMHSHNSSIMGNKLHYLTHYLGKLFIKNLATHYFGCSDKAIKWMFKGTGIYSKSRMIKNGINTSEFLFDNKERTKVRSQLNLSEKCVIGHVGRFMEVKNHVLLLKIFKHLLSKNPNYHLLLIGTGELEDEIKCKSQSMGISNNISFLGVRKDISSLMMGMDIFVMPSLYEGLPVTLIEAQASGLPVVCSSTISIMSKIIPCYYTCELNSSVDIWTDKIISTIKGSRINTREEYNKMVKDAGFDIKNTTAYLSSIYCN